MIQALWSDGTVVDRAIWFLRAVEAARRVRRETAGRPPITADDVVNLRIALAFAKTADDVIAVAHG